MTESTSYISLYRRWRPQTFADVVGQDEITRTLRNAVTAGEVAHAYLFSGERGIGKTSVARILARAVNCLNPAGGEPCNSCANCLAALAGRTLDILEIDGASNRGIDQIRALRQEVGFAPTELSTKVYVIDEVHMLTNEAFNALLKTLEEPPPHAVFVFATTEPHKLPRTIISRCQAFDFHKISTEHIAAHLREICDAEKIPADAAGLRLMSRRANGGMRDAIVLLEQAAAYGADTITEEALHDMLGLVGEDTLSTFLDALVRGDRPFILATVDSLVDRGKDLESFLADLIASLRDRIAASAPIEATDVAVCRDLLEIKSHLYRSLDRRIHLEIGLLALMDRVAPVGSGAPPDAVAASTSTPPGAASQDAAARDAEQGKSSGPSAPDPGVDPPAADTLTGAVDAEPWKATWAALLRTVAKERIAIAAFLAEASPALEGDRLTLTFCRSCAFHKESLEKPESFQYLAGAVRRALGDAVRVDLAFAGQDAHGASTLRADAEVVCDVFDGIVVREER